MRLQQMSLPGPGRLMDVISAWFGFVGVWVLVAGPMYQGAVDITEQHAEVSALKPLADALPLPEQISPW